MINPDDFARLLGITSEPDGWNDHPFTQEEDDALMAFEKELYDFKKSRSLAFWSEFAASYLPQIVESYCRRTFNISHNPNLNVGLFHYTNWMYELVLNASNFSHFIQTHDAETLALWTKVTRRISWLDPESIRDCFDYDSEFVEDFPDSSDRFLALLRLWGELHHLLVGYISY